MLIQRDTSVILKTRILGIFRWIIFKLTFDVLEVQSLTECRILWLWNEEIERIDWIEKYEKYWDLCQMYLTSDIRDDVLDWGQAIVEERR